MEVINLLHLSSRSELRQWLEENHNEEKCCWVVTYRSKCPEWSAVPYIEVVEEALCFGWIDSTFKRLPDGRLTQRLSPRRAKSHWTQLNMDRCMYLDATPFAVAVERSDSVYLTNEMLALIERLPVRQAKAFRLFIDGYSYADIAVAMCVSVDNVRNYIHAAGVALRKMLGRY